MKTSWRPVGVLLSAMTAAPGAAQGQTVVAGMVTDTLGHPLVASVSVGDAGRVESDSSGAYRLGVPPGTYPMRVLAIGYAPYHADSVRVTAGDTAVVMVVLRAAVMPVGFVWMGCAGGERRAGATCLDPHRVDATPLWVEEPGRWVIRSGTEWEGFWSRYAGSRRTQQGERPRVNWALNVLVLVGEGPTDACGNWERYVNRVLLYRDSTVVYLGPDEGVVEMTCPARRAPVDAVLVPRGYGPITFREVSNP